MVTIKDFEVPKHCGECIFHIDNYPYATHTDMYRLNAQIETQELVDYLIDDITDVAQTKGNEYSVEKARNEAIKWLKEKRDYRIYKNTRDLSHEMNCK